MGWIAAGGATLLAASFVYTICVKKSPTAKLTNIPTPEVQKCLEEKPINGLRSPVAHQLGKDGHRKPLEEQARVISVNPKPASPQRTAVSIPEKRPQIHAPSHVNSAAPSIVPPARSSSPPRLKPPTFGSMPAPPRPNNGLLAVRPPPSAASSLRVPTTKVLSNASMAPSSLMPPPNKPSRQVILKPGHSPLDWAMLTSNPNHQLRGLDVPESLVRVSPSQLKYHNGWKGKDAWTVFQGKVYNITAYLPFHPGGEAELMKGAGRDAAKLFMEVHPWVNWDGMLGECMVGILVGEGEEKEQRNGKSGGLDEMD